jgi:hypothetical protein
MRRPEGWVEDEEGRGMGGRRRVRMWGMDGRV